MTAVRLLVIDDSATVRAMVEQIVERDADCRIVGLAPDVRTARQLLVEHRPNLITLDLNMPGTGGLAFLDEVAGHHHAPIVVLSSSTVAGSSAAADAVARGAVACFDKGLIVSEAARFRHLLKKAVTRHERRMLRAAHPGVQQGH